MTSRPLLTRFRCCTSLLLGTGLLAASVVLATPAQAAIVDATVDSINYRVDDANVPGGATVLGGGPGLGQ